MQSGGDDLPKKRLYLIRKKIGDVHYLVTLLLASMFELSDQYRCPKGLKGGLVAELMNQKHQTLTLWGLAKVTTGSDFVVLDVGCGGGKTISKLAELAPQGKVFGIDYSDDMVKFSKKVNSKLIAQNRVEITKGSVEDLSFRDGFFDLVTGFETYYFWANFPDCLVEIKRVLKTGGKLLLVNALTLEVTNAELSEKFHLCVFSLEEICNFMKSAGFMDVQVFTEAKSAWNAILAQK